MAAFAGIAAAGIAVKLWLTSYIALDPHLAPHDYTNFLEHAKSILSGNWFGPYDDLTLIKGPGMPLYLAFLREFDIPVPLAHQLLYALACGVFCYAIGPLVRGGVVRGIVFLALLFDPPTFSDSAWILNRSQVIDSFALLLVACSIGAVLRSTAPISRLLPWLAFAGFWFSLFALTREDTIWIAPALLVLILAYAATVWLRRVRRRALRLVLLAVPVAVYAAFAGTIAAINGSVYGWATTVETTAPEFVSAYQSLTRIEIPGADFRTYPASEAARNEAYRASAAAAELRPYFDATHKWRETSCTLAALCDDISAGWFLWAFRDAVAGAGYYASGARARSFYIRLAAELDAACDAGRLRCRRKGNSLAPAVRLSDVPAILRLSGQAFVHVVRFDEFIMGAPAAVTAGDETVAGDYRNIAGSDGGIRRSFSGWLLHAPTTSVTLSDPIDTDQLALEMEPSPDIADAFGHNPAYRGDDLGFARFEIFTNCTADCFIVVRERAKTVAKIPLQPTVTDFSAPSVLYHLDSTSTDPAAFGDDAAKVAIMLEVAKAYQEVAPFLTAVVALALLGRLTRCILKRRFTTELLYTTVVLALVAALGSYCVVLATVSAISFNVLFAEYEIPLFPLLLAWLSLQGAVDGSVALRWLRRRFPSARPIERHESAA